jgi:hypothetical protein
MTYKSAAQVKEIAAAIEPIRREVLRAGYDRIDPKEYGFSLSDQDFEYTWSWFEELKAFYQRTADANRGVLFTASQ